ncbi:MAG: carbohydrate ABC transporter permease [Oscillospiraceae bacterium]
MSAKVKTKKHFAAEDVVFNIINYTFFILFALICAFPFYYLFINTISNNELVSSGQITLIPREVHFDNYINLTKIDALGKSFVVSVARTVLGTVLMVLASAMVGYLVTKQEMWGRKFWYRFLVITMYFNSGLIPWYLNMSMLGLTNNFLAYIIPSIMSPYNVILVKTYIESIPGELEESAAIDGAGYFTIFRKIIFPLCKPILATIAIFGAVGHWNSFTDSIILMSGNPDLHTLQHRLYTYLNQSTNLAQVIQGSNIGDAVGSAAMNLRPIKFTVAMATVIPILIVYPFMSKYFEKGIMLGAVKG